MNQTWYVDDKIRLTGFLFYKQPNENATRFYMVMYLNIWLCLHELSCIIIPECKYAWLRIQDVCVYQL